MQAHEHNDTHSHSYRYSYTVSSVTTLAILLVSRAYDEAYAISCAVCYKAVCKYIVTQNSTLIHAHTKNIPYLSFKGAPISSRDPGPTVNVTAITVTATIMLVVTAAAAAAVSVAATVVITCH